MRFHKFYMDNMYFRLHKQDDRSTYGSLYPVVDSLDSEVWLTNITMQGDGDGIPDCSICGLGSRRGFMHAEGVSLCHEYLECFNLQLWPDVQCQLMCMHAANTA